MIEVDNITMVTGNFILKNASLTVPQGKYGVLMGKTGCGKTTVLEAIAGLRSVQTGRIRLNGDDVTDLKPALRGIGYVPQDGALFGNLTVAQNIGFALQVRSVPTAKISEMVDEQAELLGIQELLSRGVQRLSGGERQRVALGRALCFRPTTLLLDEPLSALDDDTRLEMCELLRRVLEYSHCTILQVTHNHSEAERLADCMFQFEDGGIKEMATT